jgi:hypothetical protein
MTTCRFTKYGNVLRLFDADSNPPVTNIVWTHPIKKSTHRHHPSSSSASPPPTDRCRRRRVCQSSSRRRRACDERRARCDSRRPSLVCYVIGDDDDDDDGDGVVRVKTQNGVLNTITYNCVLVRIVDETIATGRVVAVVAFAVGWCIRRFVWIVDKHKTLKNSVLNTSSKQNHSFRIAARHQSSKERKRSVNKRRTNVKSVIVANL